MKMRVSSERGRLQYDRPLMEGTRDRGEIGSQAQEMKRTAWVTVTDFSHGRGARAWRASILRRIRCSSPSSSASVAYQTHLEKKSHAIINSTAHTEHRECNQVNF